MGHTTSTVPSLLYQNQAQLEKHDQKSLKGKKGSLVAQNSCYKKIRPIIL